MTRGNVVFAAGSLLVLAGLGLAYLLVVSGRQPPAPTPAAATVARLAARLIEARGDVAVQSGEADWRSAEDGQALAPGAQIRTAIEARAALGYGEDVRIELAGGTQLRLGEAREDLARVVLGEGLIFADVRGGRGPRLQITDPKGEAVAETHDGALIVSTDDAGALRAAVSRGTASMTAQGETVTIRPGFFSIAAPGRRPAAPASVPASLLLKIRWPADVSTAKRRQLVSGVTAAGTRVQVGPRTLWSDANGRFQTIVDLSEGKNRIQVRALDVAGRETRETSPEIELDTRAPKQSVETSPEMWKKR